MTRRGKSAALLVLLAAFGCGPSGGEHGGHGVFGLHHAALPLMSHALRLGMRGARPQGFRRACSEDIAKLCPNSGSRRRERDCLEEKRNLVSSECREALDRRRNHADASTR